VYGYSPVSLTYFAYCGRGFHGTPLRHCGTIADSLSAAMERNTDMAAKQEYPELEMKCDDRGDLCMILDGVKIAKRGGPGTQQAKQWVSLEPGYTIHMTATETVIEYNGVRRF
jgi:hypothetical protein